MLDRQMFGDFALAVVLMLPLATFAKMQPASHHPTVASSSVSLVAQRAPTGRISLLG